MTEKGVKWDPNTGRGTYSWAPEKPVVKKPTPTTKTIVTVKGPNGFESYEPIMGDSSNGPIITGGIPQNPKA